MFLAARHESEHLGETAGIANHDHDLIAELNRRLDALWRYDQYIANAEWRTDLRLFYERCKAQDREAIDRLRRLITQEVESNCF